MANRFKNDAERKVAQDWVAERNARVVKGWDRMQRKAKARNEHALDPKATVRPYMTVAPDVYWDAVRREGKEARDLTGDYWKWEARQHTWLTDPKDRPASPWKATSVFRDGKWWKRVGTDWVEEPPRKPRDWTK